jgi:hypothetical protein
MTSKLPFELNEELLRKLYEERLEGLQADAEAQESIELIPIALDVVTRMREAGVTNRQVSMVLRFALALILAKDEDAFCRSVSLIVDEFKEQRE